MYFLTYFDRNLALKTNVEATRRSSQGDTRIHDDLMDLHVDRGELMDYSARLKDFLSVMVITLIDNVAPRPRGLKDNLDCLLVLIIIVGMLSHSSFFFKSTDVFSSSVGSYLKCLFFYVSKM